MDMPGRSVTPIDAYSYGMNGQMRERETFEGAYSADFWGYDSRLGRRWERDPLAYPWQSPYATFNDNPIVYADPFGLEGTGNPLKIEKPKSSRNGCGKGDVKPPIKKNADGRYIPPFPALNKQSLAARGIDASKIFYSYLDRSNTFFEAQGYYMYQVFYEAKHIGNVRVRTTMSQSVLVKWYYDEDYKAVLNKEGYGPTIELDESFGPAQQELNDVVNASEYRSTSSESEMIAATFLEGAGHGAESMAAGTRYFKNVSKTPDKTQSSKSDATLKQSKTKYAFGFEKEARALAKKIGGKHLMDDKNWKSSFEDIIKDGSAEIHFDLNGIDQPIMRMISDPTRSSTNWEMHNLYKNEAAWDHTIFYYEGKTYLGNEVFSIKP
jgi:hypothetical protein